MQKRDLKTAEQGRTPVIGTVVVIGSFLCALLLSRVRIHELHTPLSLGLLLGSQLAGFDPAAIVGGIILGAFSGTQPYWQGVSAVLLYWGITRLILLVHKSCSPKIRLLIYLACCFITLPISAIYGTEELLYGVISIAVSLAAAICFRRICLSIKTLTHARMVTDSEQVFFALGIGMLLLACTDAAFLDWSLPVMLMLILTGVAVYARGVFGAAAGVLWSIMLTACTGADPILIGSVSLGAIAAAMVRERGKLFMICAFFLSGLLFQTYRSQDALAMSASNLLSGMLLFLMMPRAWLDSLRRYTDVKLNADRMVSEAIKRTEQRASHEVERMGKLLGGFSAMFHIEPEEDDSTARWTIQGALAICRNCENRRRCWKDADAMRETILTIARTAGKGERVFPSDPIDEGCRHFEDLCGSVQLSYQQALNRNAVSKHAQMQSGFVERQFSGAGAALCTYARQMRNRSHRADVTEKKIRERLIRAGLTVESLELYETNGTDMIAAVLVRPLRMKHSAVRQEIEQACGYPLRCIRVAQSERRVSFSFEQDAELHAAAQVARTTVSDTVSGDATGECRIPGGRVCFALSDGMGTGRDARRESEAAIRLLFRLCHAGVKKELVYENVNRMLLAQNEAEMYATLDAVSIDLRTGEAELLKYGAPPSYLVRDGQVSVITGEALPCGILADAKPSVIRMQLKKNDRIVLCSDGVHDMFSEDAEQVIRSVEPIGQKTGEQLLMIAKARGGTDDMTVMVISVA
ncbi:MAG: SpoIIE family protein phosphatase [Clostridia bacterium]|nr:SpoIIE family protein phosphatase [Clostridia bacterium]